jgi:hypothetical protein
VTGLGGGGGVIPWCTVLARRSEALLLIIWRFIQVEDERLRKCQQCERIVARCVLVGA